MTPQPGLGDAGVGAEHLRAGPRGVSHHEGHGGARAALGGHELAHDLDLRSSRARPRAGTGSEWAIRRPRPSTTYTSNRPPCAHLARHAPQPAQAGHRQHHALHLLARAHRLGQHHHRLLQRAREDGMAHHGLALQAAQHALLQELLDGRLVELDAGARAGAGGVDHADGVEGAGATHVPLERLGVRGCGPRARRSPRWPPPPPGCARWCRSASAGCPRTPPPAGRGCGPCRAAAPSGRAPGSRGCATRGGRRWPRSGTTPTANSSSSSEKRMRPRGRRARRGGAALSAPVAAPGGDPPGRLPPADPSPRRRPLPSPCP